METEIWIAIIGAVSSVLISVITAHLRMESRLAEIIVKLDIVYDIYVKDALRDARKRELVVENSPLLTTESWKGLIGKELLEKIGDCISTYVRRNNSKGVLQLERHVIREFGTTLYKISIDSDIPMRALWATLRVYIKEVILGETKS